MLRNYKFRVYPTKAQVTKLNKTLDLCRQLWNLGLEQRTVLWKTKKVSISLFEQHKQLTVLKQEFPEFKIVNAQVAQNVFERLDLAFKAFFRRVRRHETPGYPRFRGKGRYSSFCYPQGGFKLQGESIFLSKIGHVPIVLHRAIPGAIKRCTVSKTPTGKWFVTLSCDIEHKPSQVPIQSITGIDVGIKSFATLSNGEQISNPKFFRQDAKALAKVQRKKKSKACARIHERIRNRRENFAHQLSHELVKKYDCICIEDLNINNLKEDAHKILNREISDAAWNSFLQKLGYKAEYAGKRVEKVNPAYTSQDCSGCGYRTNKTLKDRTHECPNCGLVLDRDHNAALNILALGLQSLALCQEAILL